MAVVGSLLIYIGFVGLIFGVINLLHPIRLLRIPTREAAAVITFAAFVVMFSGGAWLSLAD